MYILCFAVYHPIYSAKMIRLGVKFGIYEYSQLESWGRLEKISPQFYFLIYILNLFKNLFAKLRLCLICNRVYWVCVCVYIYIYIYIYIYMYTHTHTHTHTLIAQKVLSFTQIWDLSHISHLCIGLTCTEIDWNFKGVQEEIPWEEASTLQIGSVAFPPGQCTSPQLHSCHRLFDQDVHQDSCSASL